MIGNMLWRLLNLASLYQLPGRTPLSRFSSLLRRRGHNLRAMHLGWSQLHSNGVRGAVIMRGEAMLWRIRDAPTSNEPPDR